MSSLDTLPKEILHEIISCVGPNLANLANCALVCKNVSEVANEEIYSHIDLQRDERYDDEADAKTDRRQANLIRSIAENPKLGSLVRTFKNYRSIQLGEVGDGTTDPALDSELLVRAARNMTWLSQALLTYNHVAAHIITNLRSYPQLVELSVYGFEPRNHIWAKAPLPLRKLSWTVPMNEWNANGRASTWSSVELLIKAVESACPELETLDILFTDEIRAHVSPNTPNVLEERAQLHAQNTQKTTREPMLANLKHLGLKYAKNEQSEKYYTELEELVQRYSRSLVSIDIPFGNGPWTRERLEHILRLCNMLPGLNSLSLTNLNYSGHQATNFSAQEFLQELCSALGSPRFQIERLSIVNIDCSFSPGVSKSFKLLKSLRYLNVGDGDMSDGPYSDDGRPQFDEYKPEILAFVQALPSSLEELFLELNGRELLCDEDEDFDVMCDMGPRIFSALRRLRSCDIHAWISNTDGGLGWIPEKCVFHRRLPHVDDTGVTDAQLDQWQRDLWTSRMDENIEQEYGTAVSIKKELLELDVGVGNPFEGKDAEEAWLGGFTHQPDYGTGDGIQEQEVKKSDFSWPSWENKVIRYEGFRRRHS